MRSFTSFSICALVISAASALVSAASVDGQCLSEICMGGQLMKEVARNVIPTPVISRDAMTNAERLSRGLSPKPPTRRGHAARQQTSATPQVTISGKIQARRQDNGAVLGYLSTATTAGGQMKYGADAAGAIKVSVTFDEGVTGGNNVRVTLLNSPGPLLGFAEGRDNTTPDLDSANFHYLYLNGISLPGSSAGSVPTIQTSVYSTALGAAKHAETDVWTIDTVTGAMSPQWINRDGSAPTTQLFSQGTYVYAGGNPTAFQSRFPSPVISLTLVFVQDVTTIVL